jgi:hypothetical protein
MGVLYFNLFFSNLITKAKEKFPNGNSTIKIFSLIAKKNISFRSLSYY